MKRPKQEASVTYPDHSNLRAIVLIPRRDKIFSKIAGYAPMKAIFPQVSGGPLPSNLSQFAGMSSTGAEGFFYNLYLVRTRTGPVVIVHMNVAFNFVIDPKVKTNFVWTATKKLDFTRGWCEAVARVWNKSSLTTTPDRRPVKLLFKFSWSIDQPMPTKHQWTIKVSNSTGNPGKVAEVLRAERVVFLASNDLTHVVKNNNIFKKFTKEYLNQVIAAHEFGHMLSWEDEYDTPTVNSWDVDSILNRGNQPRARHYLSIKQWADHEIIKMQKAIGLKVVA